VFLKNGKFKTEQKGEIMSYQVVFQKTGKTVTWDPQYDNLLELAEANGIDIEFECRNGFCGDCAVRLLSGEVVMEETEGLDAKDGAEDLILACVAIPTSDVVLDI
jgi:ferredoxin